MSNPSVPRVPFSIQSESVKITGMDVPIGQVLHIHRVLYKVDADGNVVPWKNTQKCASVGSFSIFRATFKTGADVDLNVNGAMVIGLKQGEDATINGKLYKPVVHHTVDGFEAVELYIPQSQ